MSTERIRMGRRLVLQSLATGAGVAAFAPGASAASGHAHHAAAATTPASPAASTQLVFLDQHSFDTLAVLSEQIVPGARAAKVPEFLDRLLAVESLDTQKGFTQALGAFEREARAAHAMPWKSLTEAQATTLLTTIANSSDGDGARGAFEDLKSAISDTYFSTEIGMKDLGWDGSVAFAPAENCS